jgi:hypothetical protein
MPHELGTAAPPGTTAPAGAAGLAGAAGPIGVADFARCGRTYPVPRLD